MSNDSSASRDRILVHKMPAAENALSASTDAGGILCKKLYTSCSPRPRTPLDSKTAIPV